MCSSDLAGAVRIHEGRRVVMLASRGCTLTDTAMFRSAPAVTSRPVMTCLKEGEPERPSLATGTRVSALWRTEARSTIAGRSGWWYRVQVVTTRELAATATGWIFGAFLKEDPQ